MGHQKGPERVSFREETSQNSVCVCVLMVRREVFSHSCILERKCEKSAFMLQRKGFSMFFPGKRPRPYLFIIYPCSL